MQHNVITPARPRIGAVRVRDQIRIAVPSACVIVPVTEFSLFASLAAAAEARHQRAAARASQRIA